MKLKKKHLIIAVIIIAIGYSFLISQIPWHLVLSNTMVAGGDTGSHNYVAYYAQKIFPKIKWWSPDWYAGFPFLYFYPPLLYYLTVIINHLSSIPFNVVFKLITLLGTFCLPICVWEGLRLMELDFPIPSLGALLSLSYLFLEKFSIYGGNIPSTLAGEFSYSFSFALFFLFIGLLVRGLKKQRYLIPLVGILSLMVLSHPFPVIVAILISTLFAFKGIIERKGKAIIIYLTKIFGLSFGITAFWSLPFVALLAYTSKMSWTKAIHWGEIFPSFLIIWQAIAGISIIYAIRMKDKKIIPLVFIVLAALIPFVGLNNSSIWNARFLPFILMGELLIAAYGLGRCYQKIERITLTNNPRLFFVGVIILLTFSGYFVLRYLPAGITYIPSWERWNYEGIEAKKSYPELQSLTRYLKSLPYGRVMWEYRSEYDKFGTPRILEDLPIWDNKPTFEGLLIESSPSGYFHFINQAETTKTPTSAIAGLQYPPFNFVNGVKHLQLFGAQYFIAFTDGIKQLANRYLIKLKDQKEFAVYKIPDSPLVQIIPRIKIKKFTRQWKDASIAWYKKLDFSYFLTFYHNSTEEMVFKKLTKLPYLDNKKMEKVNNSIKVLAITNDKITFSVPLLNRPYLLKYSYFPGWKVQGGEGPYLVSPSFMMIIPHRHKVTVYYDYNNWDKIGMIISLVSGLILLFWLGKIIFPGTGKLSRFAITPQKKI